MILYPVQARKNTIIEAVAKLAGWLGVCTVCGNGVIYKPFTDNYREHGYCSRCKSSNRKRQIAYLLRTLEGIPKFGKINSAKVIFSAEGMGPLHDYLKHNAKYTGSEYLGENYASGEVIDGIRHENLLKTSFGDNSVDYVLSSDVMEHIPEPYTAFEEIYRILKVGGRHIFTVPFYQTDYFDEVRAQLHNGDIVNNMEPIYHLDPHSSAGILVYNIFSMEMVLKLNKIGFRTIVHKLYSPMYGILGNNAIIFESIKSG
jgi:SAM-dependent methyltransferase